MSPLLRWPLRALRLLADLAAAGALFLCALPLIRRSSGRGMLGQGGKPHALVIAPGADMEGIYRKFGTLDVYKADNPGCFGLVTRLLPGKAFRTLPLGDDYVLVEGHTDGTRLPLFGFAWLFLQAMLRSRRQPVDLVHARSPYHAGLLGLAIARALGTPLLVSLHSDYEKRESLGPGAIPRILGSLTLARRAERLCYRLADRVCPVRGSMEPHLLAQGCPQSKIRPFPHGVNMQPFRDPPKVDVRRFFCLPQTSRLVSSVGRLVADNYAKPLLQIALELVRRHADVVVLLCGTGELEEYLRTSALREGFAERILVPGAVSLEVSRELRKQSDVNLCLMGGFSLIEACAGGRPVISYDVEWHHELVRTGETGLLAPEGSVIPVVEEILRLLNDEVLAARLGENARQLAFQRHDSERVKSMKSEMYEEVLHEQQRVR